MKSRFFPILKRLDSNASKSNQNYSLKPNSRIVTHQNLYILNKNKYMHDFVH